MKLTSEMLHINLFNIIIILNILPFIDIKQFKGIPKSNELYKIYIKQYMMHFN